MEKKYQERVELHCHTSMSEMDGVTSPRQIIEFAAEQDMNSVAFTDHANIEAYTEIESVIKLYPEIKPIYGIEAYVVDNLDPIVKGNIGEQTFCSDVVIVDLETTGLNARLSEIIEIGAAKLHHGEITQRFHSYVKPEKSISAEVSELTGIDDTKLLNEKSINEVFPEFLEFIGNEIVVFYNESFCFDFCAETAKKLKVSFKNSRIDTLELARLLLNLKKYTLNQVADELQIAHTQRKNIMDDIVVDTKIYLKLIKMLKDKGIVHMHEINSIA